MDEWEGVENASHTLVCKCLLAVCITGCRAALRKRELTTEVTLAEHFEACPAKYIGPHVHVIAMEGEEWE